MIPLPNPTCKCMVYPRPHNLTQCPYCHCVYPIHPGYPICIAPPVMTNFTIKVKVEGAYQSQSIPLKFYAVYHEFKLQQLINQFCKVTGHKKRNVKVVSKYGGILGNNSKYCNHFTKKDVPNMRITGCYHDGYGDGIFYNLPTPIDPIQPIDPIPIYTQPIYAPQPIIPVPTMSNTNTVHVKSNTIQAEAPQFPGMDKNDARNTGSID